MKVTINWEKKEATIVVPINETPTLSSTGDTSSFAAIRNQEIPGQKAPDGRPLKLSLQLYVKTPKVA